MTTTIATPVEEKLLLRHDAGGITDTVIAAQAGISGSTKIGSRVMIGGQAGFAGHIEIDDGIMLGAKAGVADSLRAINAKLIRRHPHVFGPLEAKDADCEHWSAHAGPVEIFLYNLQTGHRYLRDHWVLAVAAIFAIGGYLAGKLR